MGFQLIQKDNLKYLIIPAFKKTNKVLHGFSTRIGGYSKGHVKYLNLGFKKEKDQQTVFKNYRAFCNALGVSLDNLVAANQIHDDKIYEVETKDRGKGILAKSDLIGIDALITRERGIALTTYHADCVPIFFLDPKVPAIGVAHAGWKGTVKKIATKTAMEMKKKFGSLEKDILVGIGPCIKECCYEIDEPVVSVVKEAFPYWENLLRFKINGKYMLDLIKANKMQLETFGIKPENIHISQYCTCCNNDLFFSYRADNKRTGSLAAVIQLI